MGRSRLVVDDDVAGDAVDGIDGYRVRVPDVPETQRMFLSFPLFSFSRPTFRQRRIRYDPSVTP